MRDPNRLYKLYEKLQEIHINKFPDWCFGQLVMNIERKYGDLFYLEEDEMINVIERYGEMYGKSN